jgi:peptidoglycan/LPS O-acetylase OafA/YrhL
MSARDFRKWGSLIAALGIALLLVGLPFGILNRDRPVGAALEFTVSEWIFLGFMCFTLGLSGRGVAVLSKGPLLLAGQLSYCLYLINLIVFDQWDSFIRRFYPGELLHPTLGYYLIRVSCCVITSFLIAALSRRFLEQPVLSLKRFFPASGLREARGLRRGRSEAAA